MGGAAPQQRHGTASIAAAGMGHAYGQLGQALPEVAFGGRCGLPGGLQYLVRVKRAASGQQFIGQFQALVRR